MHQAAPPRLHRRRLTKHAPLPLFRKGRREFWHRHADAEGLAARQTQRDIAAVVDVSAPQLGGHRGDEAAESKRRDGAMRRGG